MGSDGATGEYRLDNEGTSIYGLLVSLPYPCSYTELFTVSMTAITYRIMRLNVALKKRSIT